MPPACRCHLPQFQPQPRAGSGVVDFLVTIVDSRRLAPVGRRAAAAIARHCGCRGKIKSPGLAALGSVGLVNSNMLPGRDKARATMFYREFAGELDPGGFPAFAIGLGQQSLGVRRAGKFQLLGVPGQ